MTIPALKPVETRPKTAWQADELMATTFKPPKWAVPGLISEGITLIAGPPKVGKSWLSLNLGLSIALGEPVLGSIPVESGPVLYLALEDTPRRLQSRMGKVLAGKQAPARLTLDTWCPPLPQGGDAYIAEWLDANPTARLVVVDVFAKVRGVAPVGSSAYDADYSAIGRIKHLADSYGVAVLLVHHVRKAASEDFLAEVSGTNGLAGAADAVLVLKRARAQGDGVLSITGRDVDEMEIPVRFDPETGSWSKLDGSVEDYTLRDTRLAVTRLLRDHPGLRPAGIAEALELDPAAVRQTCTRMAKDGQLRRDPGGAYYPPKPSDSAAGGEVSQLSLCHTTASDQA
jgi:hypothetical protein